MSPTEIMETAKRLSAETEGSMCWSMDPECAYFYDSLMNGFCGDDSTVWGDGTTANDMIIPSPEEREAFGLGEDDVVVLTYSSAGGAPDLEIVTAKEWEEHRDRFNAENETEEPA